MLELPTLPTASHPAKYREPLCYPLFSQVASNRTCRSEMLSWHTGKRSLHPRIDAHEPLHRIVQLRLSCHFPRVVVTDA
jgi:hypothetical protein